MSTEEANPEGLGDEIHEPEKKERSPIERTIVWGLIVGLLVVVGLEFRAQKAHAAALEVLESFYKKNPDGEMKFSDVQKAMSYSPRVDGPTQGKGHQLYVFSWLSIFKSGEFQIEVKVETGVDDPHVMSFTTPKAVELFDSRHDPNAKVYDPGDEMPEPMGMSTGGRGAGGGGGRTSRPDPLVRLLDKDADGEVSSEELEDAAVVLHEFDTNGDGELSSEEIQSLLSSSSGTGSGSGVNPNSRQRPDLE